MPVPRHRLPFLPGDKRHRTADMPDQQLPICRQESVPAASLRDKPGRARSEIFCVQGRAVAGPGALTQHLQAHLHYLHQLQMKAVLLAAGPMLDRSGAFYHGDGQFLLRTRDLEAARIIATRDPFHITGVRINAVAPWLLSEGLLYDHLMGKA